MWTTHPCGRLRHRRAPVPTRAWRAPLFLGRTLRRAGELGGEGSDAALREALGLLESGNARYELACAEIALARVTTEPQERERLLRAALEDARHCGAPGRYREAAALLRADGVDVPAEVTEPVLVTFGERRMVELVSRGAGHREVAQAMFLTPHLVEQALLSLQQRLAVTSDEELAAAIAAL